MLVPSEIPLSRIWHLNFAETKKKSSVFQLKLVSTIIKYTIQEIIDWAPYFSLLEIATQKQCFFCFIWVLKVSLRLALIQKGGLCPLRLLPLMIEFSVCALSVYSTREQLAMGHFFEGLENCIQNKNEGEK